MEKGLRNKKAVGIPKKDFLNLQFRKLTLKLSISSLSARINEVIHS